MVSSISCLPFATSTLLAAAAVGFPSLAAAQDDEGPPFVAETLELPACTFDGPYHINRLFGTTYAPISQVGKCLTSFQLDKKNVTQYLTSMMGIAQEFYVFLDQAMDPLKTVSSQTPLGYTIYNGTQQGQVDVMTEMIALLDEVESDTIDPSLDIIYRVNDIYNRLWDAHTSVNVGMSLDAMTRSNLYFATGEVVNGREGAPSTSYLTVAYPSTDGEFSLQQNLQTPDGEFTFSEETKAIATIDGMDPLEWVTEFVKIPLGFAPLRAFGARAATLLRVLTFSSDGPFFASITGNAKYSAYLNDTIDVTYTDGNATQWHLFQDLPTLVEANLTREDIDAALVRPGYLYETFATARDDIAEFFFETLNATSRALKEVSKRYSPASKRRRMQLELPVNFTMFGDHVGYIVYEDYAVFKIDDFDLEVDVVLPAWESLLNAAAEKDVTKLIIDLNENGGGQVVTGSALAKLMHPNSTWEDIANPNDQLYTDSMEIFWGGIIPLVDNIKQTLEEEGLQPSLDALNADLDLLVLKLQGVLVAMEAISAIAPSSDNTAAVAATRAILGDVDTEPPTEITEEQLTLLISQLNSVFDEIKTQGLQTGLVGDNTFNVFGQDNPDSVSFIRGGLLGNYTQEFYTLSPDVFQVIDAAIDTFDNPNQFEEYLILSDGALVGSTSCLFQTTSMFYYNSNPDTAIPVHTVSFSGTGKQEDAATSQFCGGAVLGANLAPLWVPDILLLVLAILFSANPEVENEIADVLVAFDSVIPEPCYYCLSSPRFTAIQMYSNLVGTNSTPVEFINQIPDYYIPQWATETGFSYGGGDLPLLYNSTAEFFEKQDTGMGGGNDDNSPTSSPNPPTSSPNSPTSGPSSSGTNTSSSGDTSGCSAMAVGFPLTIVAAMLAVIITA